MKMFIWRSAAVGVVIDRGGKRGVQRAAERVLARANEHVPFRSGALKESGKVTVDGFSASISYHTVYAARLHQNPQYNFNPPGEGRWLLNAVEDEETKHRALAEFAGAYRDELGRFAVRPG